MPVSPIPDVNPRLQIPSSRPTRMFREIVRALMSDGNLWKIIKTWRVWDGSPTSDDPYASGNLPLVQVMPILGATGQRDNISQGGILTVEITSITDGLNADDAMDLWDKIQNVVYPSSQPIESAMRQRLLSLGGMATPIKIDRPASMQPDPDNKIIVAVGSFSVTYRIQG